MGVDEQVEELGELSWRSLRGTRASRAKQLMDRHAGAFQPSARSCARTGRAQARAQFPTSRGKKPTVFRVHMTSIVRKVIH